MLSFALWSVTPADTERETADPLQRGNSPPGAVGNPHRLTTSNTVAPLGSEQIFRRRSGATVFSCHHVLTFLQEAEHPCSPAHRAVRRS